MVPLMDVIDDDVFYVVQLDYMLINSVDDRPIYVDLIKFKNVNNMCLYYEMLKNERIYLPSSVIIGRASFRRKSDIGMLVVDDDVSEVIRSFGDD
jgi:hypothetical protein